MSLPSKLIRVEWSAAVGFPFPDKRHITARNFASEKNAGRQLAIIEALPSHLTLLSVHETHCEWQPVDPDTLPRPDQEDESDER